MMVKIQVCESMNDSILENKDYQHVSDHSRSEVLLLITDLKFSLEKGESCAVAHPASSEAHHADGSLESGGQREMFESTITSKFSTVFKGVVMVWGMEPILV